VPASCCSLMPVENVTSTYRDDWSSKRKGFDVKKSIGVGQFILIIVWLGLIFLCFKMKV
jgi:hypothetical protein